MKRTIISVVAGLILLIVTYFLSNWIMNSGDEIVAKAVTAEENVKVTNVKNSTNDATLSLNSIVQSENKLQLISEVTGIIDFTNIRFKKGQEFKKGQTIIKINSDEAEAFLRQSRSQFQNQIASVLADIKIDYPESYKKWEDYFLNYDIETNILELPEQSSNNELEQHLMCQCNYFLKQNLSPMPEDCQKLFLNYKFGSESGKAKWAEDLLWHGCEE